MHRPTLTSSIPGASIPSTSHTVPTVLATISGYEVFVVALALLALAIMVGSALVGVLTRFRRGSVEEKPEQRTRFRRRR